MFELQKNSTKYAELVGGQKMAEEDISMKNNNKDKQEHNRCECLNAFTPIKKSVLQLLRNTNPD